MTMTSLNRQSGFSLIDLLIGVAISMFGLLAVAVVFRDFGQQRTTQVNASESQTNGTMALYLLERDIGQAGYAMSGLQNCSYISYYYAGDTVSPAHFNDPYGASATATALTTLPVHIVDGGASSDTITVQFGNPAAGGAGSDIKGPATYPSDYPVSSYVGFTVGDKAVADINGICTMVEVTSNPTAVRGTPISTVSINHNNTDSSFNPATAPNVNGWNSVATSDLTATPRPFLYNLGDFVSRRYSVGASGGTFSLMLDEFPYVSVATTMVDEIVYLKAQYGLAGALGTTCPTGTAKVVTAWADGTAAINNGNVCHVIAVRVGVVARSPLYEKNGINAPTTLTVLPALGTAAAVNYTIPNLDSSNPSDNSNPSLIPRAHYRYRTYSTIIPLRNMIWN